MENKDGNFEEKDGFVPKSFEALSAGQKEFISNRIASGCSYARIAEELGWSEHSLSERIAHEKNSGRDFLSGGGERRFAPELTAEGLRDMINYGLTLRGIANHFKVGRDDVADIISAHRFLWGLPYGPQDSSFVERAIDEAEMDEEDALMDELRKERDPARMEALARELNAKRIKRMAKHTRRRASDLEKARGSRRR